MIPTFVALIVMLATPFEFVRTDFVMPAPRIRIRWFLSASPLVSRQVAFTVTLRPTNTWLRFSRSDLQTGGGTNGAVQLPKSLPGSSCPEVSVMPYPPSASAAIAAHFVFDGSDCVQPGWSTSQTMYMPGLRLRLYAPPPAVVAEAAIVVSPASSVPLPFPSP